MFPGAPPFNFPDYSHESVLAYLRENGAAIAENPSEQDLEAISFTLEGNVNAEEENQTRT